jgi:hypothetical protein
MMLGVWRAFAFTDGNQQRTPAETRVDNRADSETGDRKLSGRRSNGRSSELSCTSNKRNKWCASILEKLIITQLVTKILLLEIQAQNSSTWHPAPLRPRSHFTFRLCKCHFILLRPPTQTQETGVTNLFRYREKRCMTMPGSETTGINVQSNK